MKSFLLFLDSPVWLASHLHPSIHPSQLPGHNSRLNSQLLGCTVCVCVHPRCTFVRSDQIKLFSNLFRKIRALPHTHTLSRCAMCGADQGLCYHYVLTIASPKPAGTNGTYAPSYARVKSAGAHTYANMGTGQWIIIIVHLRGDDNTI